MLVHREDIWIRPQPSQDHTSIPNAIYEILIAHHMPTSMDIVSFADYECLMCWSWYTQDLALDV